MISCIRFTFLLHKGPVRHASPVEHFAGVWWSVSCIPTALRVEIMPKRSQENKGKERKRKGREEGNAVRIRVDGDEAEVGTNTAHSAPHSHQELCPSTPMPSHHLRKDRRNLAINVIFFTGALPVFYSSVYRLGDKQDFSIRKLGCSSHILCAIMFLAFLFWLTLNRLFVLLPRMRLAVGQSRSSPNITPRPVSWVAKLQIQKVPGCCLGESYCCSFANAIWEGKSWRCLRLENELLAKILLWEKVSVIVERKQRADYFQLIYFYLIEKAPC